MGIFGKKRVVIGENVEIHNDIRKLLCPLVTMDIYAILVWPFDRNIGIRFIDNVLWRQTS